MQLQLTCVTGAAYSSGGFRGGKGGANVPVMVKMDPPKLVPPGTNFLINKDPPEFILLQNMDSR